MLKNKKRIKKQANNLGIIKKTVVFSLVCLFFIALKYRFYTLLGIIALLMLPSIAYYALKAMLFLFKKIVVEPECFKRESKKIAKLLHCCIVKLLKKNRDGSIVLKGCGAKVQAVINSLQYGSTGLCHYGALKWLNCYIAKLLKKSRRAKKRVVVRKRTLRQKEFVLPLYFGWEVVIRRVEDLRKHIIGPFKKYWQYMTTVAVLIVIVSAGFFINNYYDTRAATYSWTQTDWTGGADGGTFPDHTNNQSNWTKYSSVDTNLATSTDLSLSATTASSTIDFTTDGNYTQEDSTSGTDFDSGAVNLHDSGISSIALGEWRVESDNLVIVGTGSDGYNMWPRPKNCPGTYNDTACDTMQEGRSACLGLTWEGYSDWFLTDNIGNLSDLCSNKSYIEATSDQYWTNAQSGATYGTVIFLDCATEGLQDTTAGLKARCMRTGTASVSYPTTKAYYVTTASSSQIDTSTWAEISSIDVTETTPANTSIKYYVSFDDRSNWKYWSGSAWISTTTLDNLQIYGMSTSTLETISSSGWSSSGGFQAGTTATLDFAADLLTTDSLVTPELDQIKVHYTTYPSSQTLTSSAYNTESSENVVAGPVWNEDATLPTGTGITVYLRASSSSALIATTDWSEVASTTAAGYITSGCTKSGTTVTCDNSVIPAGMKDGTGDQWAQYKVELTSTGANTPTLSDITVRYVVNAPPDFESAATASQDSDGLVNISYSVRDEDTTTDYVTPSFEYSLDNGGTWASITSGLSASATTTKTVEAVSYTTHSLTWTAKTQIDGQYSTTAKIKVTVDDSDLANNTASSTTAAFTLDTADPTSASIIVIASTTSATLILSASDDSSLQMKTGLASDLSDGSWVTYDTSSTISLATDPDTVYVQYKDVYGNTSSIVSATTPETPTTMMIQDTSNIPNTEYRLFVAWKVVADPTPGFSQYEIYRSLDGTNYSFLAAVTDRTTNYYGDSTVSFDTLYYYKVATKDDDSNASYFSAAVNGKANGTQDAGEGGGGTETTAPTISNVATSSVYTTQATITWDTDELANSTIGYSTTAGNFTNETGVATMLDSASGVGVHSVTLTGLTANTTYYFQVKSTDPSGNIATSTQDANGYVFTTLSGPSISNVSSDPNNVSATITWTTDTSSNSYVVYSANSDLSGSTETGSAATVTSHSVEITGLTAGTKYYYYVKSGVAQDKNIVDGAATYYNFITTSDTAAPTITFDSENNITGITDTTATISWTTNETATSTLEYGLDNTYGSTETNNNYNTNHSYDLSGLTLGTTYYFRIKSTDVNSNTATSDDSGNGWTFTTTDSTDTTAPNITANPFASSIGDTYAVINWTTNEASASTVNYGVSSGSYTLASTSNSLNISHSVTLTNLTADTTYYYQATSTDANSNATSSAEYSFTTLEALSEESAVSAREDTARAEGVASVDTTTGGGGMLIVEKTIDTSDKIAPIISSITVSDITSDSAVVKWATNESSNSFVEYGLTNSYGNINGQFDNATSHAVALEYLLPEINYHYRVVSMDSSGNLSRSSGKTFLTLSLEQEIEQELNQEETELSYEEIQKLTEDQTKLTEDQASLEEERKKQEEEKTKAENLFKIASKAAEKAMSIIKQAASRISINSLESTLYSQFDSIDELSQIIPAPVMSGEPKVITTAKTAIISWQTDKQSNSIVALAPAGQYNAGAKEPYLQKIGNRETRTANHVVTIYDLEPNTLYHYQLQSKASIGPIAKSKDFTFKTNQEILEIGSHTIQNVSSEKVIFKWITSVEADSTITYIPYRNNILSVDEARTKHDKAITTIHEIEIDDFEAGVTYEIDLISEDTNNNIDTKKITAFSTSKEDLPPIIYQVQTASAISPGKNVKVQTIISWKTNEPSTTRVYYQKGIVGHNQELSEITKLDANYTKKHVAVITKFDPGVAYSFKVESIDSGGNTSLSKIYTILTPRQKESVFQVIMKNMEDVFGWVGKMK